MARAQVQWKGKGMCGGICTGPAGGMCWAGYVQGRRGFCAGKVCAGIKARGMCRGVCAYVRHRQHLHHADPHKQCEQKNVSTKTQVPGKASEKQPDLMHSFYGSPLVGEPCRKGCKLRRLRPRLQIRSAKNLTRRGQIPTWLGHCLSSCLSACFLHLRLLALHAFLPTC